MLPEKSVLNIISALSPLENEWLPYEDDKLYLLFKKISIFPWASSHVTLCLNSTVAFFFFGWNQMVICKVTEIISSQHLKWYLKNFLFYIISLLSPKPWDRRLDCGSQAFVDGGWQASKWWYQVLQTSGRLKGRPRRSQKLHSFPHTWALTIAPLKGLEDSKQGPLLPWALSPQEVRHRAGLKGGFRW